MLTYKTILIKLEENKATIKKYGVKEIGLFSSYLRNEQKSTNGIDILVEFDSEIDLPTRNAASSLPSAPMRGASRQTARRDFMTAPDL